jgi:NADH dehydrogenase
VRRRIALLGGTGFVGRHVAAKLVATGHSVVVPTRRRERGKDLLPLPTVELIEADLHDDAALERIVGAGDAVVNLVGILHQRGAQSFQRVHAELPARVVAACKRAGVRRLVHMSALGAAPDSPSEYQRTKAEGEARVAGSGLAWTIFRPSIIFGRGDSFLTMLARLLRMLPVVALAAPQARFQPVWVGDVAHAFAQAVDDDRTIGQRYDLAGPRVYTLRELVEWVGETSGHIRPIVPLGPGLSKLQASVLEHLPGPLMTRDNLASMQVDNVTDAPFPPVFGVAPAALEAVAPEYLAPAATHSRYEGFRAHSGR